MKEVIKNRKIEMLNHKDAYRNTLQKKQRDFDIPPPPLRYRAGSGGVAPELVSFRADGWLAPGAVPAEREKFFGQV